MLPFFYQETLPETSDSFILNEATSKHCIQVLRMQEKEKMLLTDGKGKKAEAEILSPDRKKCAVRITGAKQEKRRGIKLSLGISFTKNKSRNEWLLEKATELGTEYIFPLLTERSEKEKFNLARYKQVLIAAMLQSQQCFLPELAVPEKLHHFLKDVQHTGYQKFIAHCLEEQKVSLLSQFQKGKSCLALIGPEGDFSPAEIESCLQSGFIPVTLGNNRLRTETAALYACTVFNAFHYA
jgi:16S rRNA (uracil1498-N3)-methyltransferase